MRPRRKEMTFEKDFTDSNRLYFFGRGRGGRSFAAASGVSVFVVGGVLLWKKF